MNPAAPISVLETLPYQIELDKEEFRLYHKLIVKFNPSLNLVSQKDVKELEIKHFLDSLAPKYFGLITDNNLKVLDFGTGCGFPGIPLKIAFPSLSMYLLEQSRKKAVFLEMAVKVLNLKETKILKGEAKNFLSIYHNYFDLLLSRATGPLKEVLKIALPLVKEGGKLIFYKGKGVEKELESVKEYLVKNNYPYETHPYLLTLREDGRNLLVIRKG
ncbi:MAG: Ribosomal RNA small subunit methyltransferase G [candidate division WS2 bacterium]|nr:Ribosomal RNA small subunit methyltransferase G [Candidatus Lithacetigena glycinireducens]